MRNKWISLLFLTACGGTYHADGDVTVHHILEVDVSSLESYFRQYCELKFTKEEDIQDCVTEEVGRFLDLLAGSKGTSGSSISTVTSK